MDNVPHHTHSGEWDRFILRCPTFKEASEFAAEHDWWLHAWKWEEAEDGLEMIDKFKGDK